MRSDQKEKTQCELESVSSKRQKGRKADEVFFFKSGVDVVSLSIRR